MTNTWRTFFHKQSTNRVESGFESPAMGMLNYSLSATMPLGLEMKSKTKKLKTSSPLLCYTNVLQCSRLLSPEKTWRNNWLLDLMFNCWKIEWSKHWSITCPLAFEYSSHLGLQRGKRRMMDSLRRALCFQTPAAQNCCSHKRKLMSLNTNLYCLWWIILHI